MDRILVIDHPIEDRESFFIGRLTFFLYHSHNYQPDVRSYTSLEGVNPADYAAVISASGFCKIRGNEQLNDENQLTDRCEAEDIPMLYLSHGAQVKSVHLWGDEAIAKSESPRTGVHSDYRGVNDAEHDILLESLDIGSLASKEYHKYDIVKMGAPFVPLLVDPAGHPILARHQNSFSYMSQMHPEYVPKPCEEVNSIRLMANFLTAVRQKKS